MGFVVFSPWGGWGSDDDGGKYWGNKGCGLSLWSGNFGILGGVLVGDWWGGLGGIVGACPVGLGLGWILDYWWPPFTLYFGFLVVSSAGSY